MEQVRRYKREPHHCAHADCEHERSVARHMAESTLSVLRMGTDLDTEHLVETLHGFVLLLEAFREFNETVQHTSNDEEVTLTDVQNAAKSALWLIGEELLALQDLDVI